MPLLRYFVFVGGALLALLFVSNALVPKAPDEVRADSEFDKSTIRIQSERKWPARVVFDTNQPTIIPTPAATATASVQAPAAVADVSSKARMREAFAQLPPPGATRAQLSDPGSRKSRRRKSARSPSGTCAPVMLVAQQPQFSLFGNIAGKSTSCAGGLAGDCLDLPQSASPSGPGSLTSLGASK